MLDKQGYLLFKEGNVRNIPTLYFSCGMYILNVKDHYNQHILRLLLSSLSLEILPFLCFLLCHYFTRTQTHTHTYTHARAQTQIQNEFSRLLRVSHCFNAMCMANSPCLSYSIYGPGIQLSFSFNRRRKI